MENRDDNRLDNYADRISRAVDRGVEKLEEAFEKGRAELRRERAEGREGRPRRGVWLLIIGIVWLLYSVGALSHPVLPILTIVLAIYLIVRSKDEDDSGAPPAEPPE